MEKSFDCVEMKHAIQAEIQKETAGMSNEQLYRYWKEQEKKMVAEGLLPTPKRLAYLPDK